MLTTEHYNFGKKERKKCETFEHTKHTKHTNAKHTNRVSPQRFFRHRLFTVQPKYFQGFEEAKISFPSMHTVEVVVCVNEGFLFQVILLE